MITLTYCYRANMTGRGDHPEVCPAVAKLPAESAKRQQKDIAQGNKIADFS